MRSEQVLSIRCLSDRLKDLSQKRLEVNHWILGVVERTMI